MRNPFVLFNTLFTVTEDLRKADYTACSDEQAQLCNDVRATCVEHWMGLFELNPKARESKLRSLSEEELDRLVELIELAERACAMVTANA